MAENAALKLAGYPLCLCLPLLAPVGVWLNVPWLSPIVIFGLFPLLGLLIGEDHSLPLVGLRSAATHCWWRIWISCRESTPSSGWRL